MPERRFMPSFRSFSCQQGVIWWWWRLAVYLQISFVRKEREKKEKKNKQLKHLEPLSSWFLFPFHVVIVVVIIVVFAVESALVMVPVAVVVVEWIRLRWEGTPVSDFRVTKLPLTSFETPSIEPELPPKDHLPKHGTPAFQK